ncbi:MAG: hypothetical protein A2Y18_00310 [Clostridiales bacterium GWD2_32_19]|nr:MAG: hypothetical protein A2Y18_00310 [Clostridiales bacterium GWD2_32_19]
MEIKEEGFTLIELIVVIVILAIVFVMSSSGFDMTSSSMEINTANSGFKQILKRTSQISKARKKEHIIQILDGIIKIVDSDSLVELESIKTSNRISYKVYMNSVQDDKIVVDKDGYLKMIDDEDELLVKMYYRKKMDQEFHINKYMIISKED